ncbi:UNVERIFIED_CONTAM: hypothetical protein FKN15_001130 [Acipenser sinensis]
MLYKTLQCNFRQSNAAYCCSLFSIRVCHSATGKHSAKDSCIWAPCKTGVDNAIT